jgi:hypothetical protein
LGRTGQTPGQTVYIVLFEEGRNQPSDSELNRLVSGSSAQTRILEARGSLGAARLITLR